jgi:SAM-dependent methyltransferase
MIQQSPSPAEMFDQYFGPALFAPWARVLLEYAQPQPGERVLDLACATGTVARHVAPIVGEGAKVVGIDINPGMLAVARSRPAPESTSIEWREGDATALDLPDDAFDLVLCQQGLQFFPERIQAAHEMYRVLKPGGRVVLNVWQGLEHHPVYEALCKAEARHLGVPLDEIASPWSLPDPQELRAILAEAGFERIEVVSESLEVHFPSPERFVELTLFAAAAFLPEFDWEDESQRASLIESVSAEIAPVLQRYRSGDALSFPTYWNVAISHKA